MRIASKRLGLYTSAVATIVVGVLVSQVIASPGGAPLSRIPRPNVSMQDAEPSSTPTARPKERKLAAPVVAPAPRPVALPAVQKKVEKADPGYSNSPTGAADKVALLVGINKAPGSTPLEGSITDVNNMKKTLMKYGFKESNIQVLTESKASRSGILNGLSSLANRSKSNGLAVFLLATHSGQSGGDLTFATGGGGRISRHELASKLGQVRGRLWSMLPTCYSKGYSLPGVVGKNRIAVFSSNEDEYTWQLGGAGSWLVLYMVRYAMLEGSKNSVEAAFAWSKKKLDIDAPDRAPILSDGVSGDFVLGKGPVPKPVAPKPSVKPVLPEPIIPTPSPEPTTRPCGLLGGLFGGCR